MHSLISAWARCSRVEVKAARLLGNQASLLSYDFSLGAQAAKLESEVFHGSITAAQIVDRHTHVPLYASLKALPQARSWRAHLLSMPDHRDTWAVGIRRLGTVEAPTLRRCPQCVAEDRIRYGCAHWRVFHQWPVAQHCAKHGVRLETSCARCRAPFTRVNEPRLADDPCLVCGGGSGMSQPFDPPEGYWPMLRRMYDLLDDSGSVNEWLTQYKCSALVNPFAINAPRRSSPLRAAVDRMLRQWHVESIEQLAIILGVNWIWFNEAERSSHMKGLPPLIGLALMVCNPDLDRNQARAGDGPEAANNDSLRVAA
jgi:hypothetical protein